MFLANVVIFLSLLDSVEIEPRKGVNLEIQSFKDAGLHAKDLIVRVGIISHVGEVAYSRDMHFLEL